MCLICDNLDLKLNNLTVGDLFPESTSLTFGEMLILVNKICEEGRAVDIMQRDLWDIEE